MNSHSLSWIFQDKFEVESIYYARRLQKLKTNKVLLNVWIFNHGTNYMVYLNTVSLKKTSFEFYPDINSTDKL